MKIKFPFWVIIVFKILVSIGIWCMLANLIFTDGDREARNLKYKEIEKKFKPVQPQDVEGFWIEQRKAQRSLIANGDRTKYLYISQKKGNLFNVKYKIDADSIYNCPFVLTGNELNGEVPGFLGVVMRKIILDGQDQLMYDKTIFYREGVPKRNQRSK